MTPRKYYGGSVARGHAADIRAAEVQRDYEVKARKADRELSSVEYVLRNGPPGPVLTLMRSVPPTIGLVVGARGKLSRSVKQFVSDCAEMGSISPERIGCCHGESPGPRYNRQLHQRRVWPGLLEKRSSGPTRGSHSYHGPDAVYCMLLATRARRVCGGPRTRGTRLATRLATRRLRAGSPLQREPCGGAILGWQSRLAAGLSC